MFDRHVSRVYLSLFLWGPFTHSLSCELEFLLMPKEACESLHFAFIQDFHSGTLERVKILISTLFHVIRLNERSPKKIVPTCKTLRSHVPSQMVGKGVSPCLPKTPLVMIAYDHFLKIPWYTKIESCLHRHALSPFNLQEGEAKTAL